MGSSRFTKTELDGETLLTIEQTAKIGIGCNACGVDSEKWGISCDSPLHDCLSCFVFYKSPAEHLHRFPANGQRNVVKTQPKHRTMGMDYPGRAEQSKADETRPLIGQDAQAEDNREDEHPT